VQADRAALPAGAFAGYHFSRAALNGSDDAATVNRLAWAIAGLTGLTALASVLVSVLGGHAILLVAATWVAISTIAVLAVPAVRNLRSTSFN
jgi:hypothetical protein